MSDFGTRLGALLGRYPAIKLAILFGSMADGTGGPDSDIDVGVLADTPLSVEQKRELTESIAIEFGRAVDMVDMYGVPEPILGQVFKGERVLGDTATYAQLLTRHLFNTADFLPLHQRILDERRRAWTKS